MSLAPTLLVVAITFPVQFHLFGRSIHAHALFEVLAYVVGFQTYLLIRRRQRAGAALPVEQNLWVIVGCVFGALIGAKVLAWLESPIDYWSHRHELAAWAGGKTIVGGLLGGWVGVEVAKRIMGVTRRTGDAFVFPLILGIAIGRVGCFLTGLSDHTHGIATSLPWAVDFGDGVPRHPTQLYEMAFLFILGALLIVRSRRALEPGELFRWFLLGYLAFRFLVEFIKPRYTIPFLNLSAIQIASLLGACICAIQLLRGRRGKRKREADDDPTHATAPSPAAA
jgi:phosphatidylglycerol:prolipoprotein diacylglycerol transferase